MFKGCENLVSIDLNSFNTEKVTDMGNLITGCSKLKSIDLSPFNMEHQPNIQGFILFCDNLSLVKTPSVMPTSTSFYNDYYCCPIKMKKHKKTVCKA